MSSSLGPNPPLTPRHLAVIGFLQSSPGPVSAEIIADELHLDVMEVLRLLKELVALEQGRTQGS
jgi:hypothetical protein